MLEHAKPKLTSEQFEELASKSTLKTGPLFPLPLEVVERYLPKDPDLKAYLDVLPDLLARGVKLCFMSEGKILAEAFGSGKEYAKEDHFKESLELYAEIKETIRRKYGERYLKDGQFSLSMLRPDPDELKRFHYYYRPEDAKSFNELEQ